MRNEDVVIRSKKSKGVSKKSKRVIKVVNGSGKPEE